MITPERVLSVLQRLGPCMPVQIKKELGEGDTFIVGAVLTELIRAGKAKVSTLKRGGSPFYLVPEHTSRLAQFVDDLGEKDRRSAVLLRESKVLRDSVQDPLVRVSLRQIKDFAVPVEVTRRDGQELFWKWFLVSNADAEALIKEQLGINKSQPSEAPVQKDTKAAEVVQSLPTPVREVVQKSPEAKDNSAKQGDQRTLADAVPASKVDAQGDEFLERVLEYFAEKRIQVISKKVVRKNSDVEFELSVPSAVGRVEYFCRAKNKKKSGEGDLSSLYVQGQVKRLPVMYVAGGVVAKKAFEKTKSEYKGLVVVEIS